RSIGNASILPRRISCGDDRIDRSVKFAPVSFGYGFPCEFFRAHGSVANQEAQADRECRTRCASSEDTASGCYGCVIRNILLQSGWISQFLQRHGRGWRVVEKGHRLEEFVKAVDAG